MKIWWSMNQARMTEWTALDSHCRSADPYGSITELSPKVDTKKKFLFKSSGQWPPPKENTASKILWGHEGQYETVQKMVPDQGKLGPVGMVLCFS